MKVLLVEDDYLQAESLINDFEEAFKDIEVRRVKTERQFRSEIQEIESFAPDLIILDIMLRWGAPFSEEQLLPEGMEDIGHWRAGFRCLEIISNSKELYNTPVILHSVLAREDIKEELNGLPKHVLVCRKSPSTEELFKFVRSALKELPEDNLKKKGILSRLVDSSELKPGWLGIKIDLKSVFGRKKK